jgi:hypothetical protein
MNSTKFSDSNDVDYSHLQKASGPFALHPTRYTVSVGKLMILD